MIHLSGQLVCADADQAAIVRAHLPLHIALTRAEPGCVRFDVTPQPDGLIWQVSETFVDQSAFDAHQARTAASDWTRCSAGIERRFQITKD